MKEEEKFTDTHTVIEPMVIATIAAAEAQSCFGIVGLGEIHNGIAMLFRSEKAEKGVTVRMDASSVEIDFHIIVAYGVNIPSLVDNLSEAVSYHVESFTGLTVRKINVYVEGVRSVD